MRGTKSICYILLSVAKITAVTLDIPILRLKGGSNSYLKIKFKNPLQRYYMVMKRLVIEPRVPVTL